MKNILLIGGDARSIEVIYTLNNAGNSLHIIGFDQYNFTDKNITQVPTSTKDFSAYDIVILPVDGVSPSGEVNCPYGDGTFTLTEKKVATTPGHCKILSGITNDYLKKITAPRQLEVIFARDDIAIYNSIPTAEATLNIAIEETDVTIHGASIAVLGYGRVGFTVTELFKQVGADVTAFMRSDENFAKSAVMGTKAIHTDQLAEKAAMFSVIINTVPHQLVDKAVLAKMEPATLVIDLASKPGGTDFKAAEKLGIKAVHALGLPGKTAPKTAGEILASTIMKMLEK